MKSRSAVAAVACAGAICLWAAPSAGAADTVYWGNLNGATLSSANLDGSGNGQTLNTLGNATQPSSVEGTGIDAAAGRIYWANNAGTISYASLSGGDSHDLSTDPATPAGVAGLAIDPPGGKIYWIEGAGDQIGFANLDGSGGDYLDTGMATIDAPQGIAVDHAAGKIYWGNQGDDTIWSANLDGSGGQQLDTGSVPTAPNSPRGVAVDPIAGRIWWPDGGASAVSSVKLPNGGDGEDINTSGAGLSGPFGPAIDPDAGRIYMPNVNGSFSILNLDNSGGDPLSILPLTSATESPAYASILKAPVGTAKPRIIGGPTSGSTLSCSNGSYAPDLLGAFLYRAPQSFSHQWSRDGTDIAGATGNTVTADQAGSYACKVTATNHAGSTSQTSDAVTVKASNEFTLGSAKKNKKKGTAKLPVSVPGGGTLDLSGSKVKGATQNPSSAGTVDFTVKAKGKAKKKLKKKGKAKVSFSVTFSPNGGDPKTEDGSVKLVKKKHR